MPSPATTGEPLAGEDPSDFNAEVVAALSHPAEMINQGLQFGTFGGEEGFTVERRGKFLVFGGHSLSIRWGALMHDGEHCTNQRCEGPHDRETDRKA